MLSRCPYRASPSIDHRKMFITKRPRTIHKEFQLQSSNVDPWIVQTFKLWFWKLKVWMLETFRVWKFEIDFASRFPPRHLEASRTLEVYLSQFDVEKLEMASVMGICGGLVGPKSEHIKNVLVFIAFLEGSREGRVRKGDLNPALSDNLGVTFWYTRLFLGYFGINSGVLCRNFGYTKVLLKNTHLP